MNILVVFGVIAIVLVVVTLELVRLRRLKERYAAIWVAFALTVAVGAFFPAGVQWLSNLLGFEVLANLVISAGIVVLGFIAIQLSVEITRIKDALERITTRLAIIEVERSTDPQTAAEPTGPE